VNITNIFFLRRIFVMQKGRIAIPSVAPGGLDGERSGHFGHCDVFTLVDVEGGKIVDVMTVPNHGHSEGGCLAPVNLLSGHNVNALVVGGIGMRPLVGFKQVGIDVYYDATHTNIGMVVEELLKGRLHAIADDQVCQGHGPRH
jgi:predicted Fe-Mo cluster-binding NifX family protein